MPGNRGFLWHNDLAKRYWIWGKSCIICGNPERSECSASTVLCFGCRRLRSEPVDKFVCCHFVELLDGYGNGSIEHSCGWQVVTILGVLSDSDFVVFEVEMGEFFERHGDFPLWFADASIQGLNQRNSTASDGFPNYFGWVFRRP
jgi:hypothetical protein